jgi:hypothetical protein
MQASRRRFRIAVLVLLATLITRKAFAQSPRLELDHVYIVVEPPPARGVEALRRVGVVFDTTIQHHSGEGTASMAAFFDNAYLELIWVDSATAVDSAHVADLADFRRAANWRESGASPFGLGLHFLAGRAAELPIPTRREAAPHLGPNEFYLVLRGRDESKAADVFVVPPIAAVTTWLDRYRARRPEVFSHPLGAHRITRVTLRGSPPNRPRAMDLDVRPIVFEPSPTQYVILQLDGGLQGREVDLRPVLPLVLRR